VWSVWRDRARAAAPWLAVGAAVAVAVAVARRFASDEAQCGPGFRASGARCEIPPGAACPAPLASSRGGCDAPPARVLVPAARFTIGPSDWEAEGRVPARTIETRAFYIDAFEVTVGRWSGAGGADAARAASAMTRDEAAAFCKGQGGRLPTEDEWVAAASSGASAGTALRYPWGETGAVCRRAAWGLRRGPCSRAGDGPDTVGAHPTGDTALGLHDMAGNVAEWVAAGVLRPSVGVAHGGSWQAELATELRVWARLELPADARDPRVGTRCVYDVGDGTQGELR